MSMYLKREIKKAIETMIKAHDGQTRDDGKDYITHPIEVAYLLTRNGIQEDEILIVALLHDVLEDSTKYSYMDLRTFFGSEMASGVFLLTRQPGENKDSYYNRIRKSRSKFRSIKLADRLHNLSDMDGWMVRRKRSYARDTLRLLRAIPRIVSPELWDKLDLKAKDILRDNNFIGE